MSAAHDLTGRMFGALTVLRRDESKKGGDAFWVCRCGRCGQEKSIRGVYLTGPRAYRDCGCSWNERKADLTGRAMGGVDVLELLPDRRRGQKAYRVRCRVCGGERIMVQHDLLAEPEDCGCAERGRRDERLRSQSAGAVQNALYDGTQIKAAYATDPLPTSKTGFRWVRWYPRNNCWCATFRIQGKRYFKYGFETPESAYKWAREEHDRIIAQIGVPRPAPDTEE